MSTTHITQTNRALRKLYNCLDEVVLPYLSEGILLAISGGPDSRALLESVALWPSRIFGKIIVCSVDHGLRKESKQESDLVRMRALRLGFDSLVETIVPLEKGEAYLREKRYQILTDIAKKHNIKSLVTAHHRDDNAEGFLLALGGLGGGFLGEAMSPVGNMNGLLLLRPFLSLSKADIMLPLGLLDQTDYAHDSLDEARVGQRAFVRHEVLPNLNALTPNIKERLAFFAENNRKQNYELKKNALDLITCDKEDEFKIDLNKNISLPIIECAIREALKKCSINSDLRSSRPTLSKLMLNIKRIKGLDHKANLFKFNKLEEKVYLFPSAKVITQDNFLIIRRI